MAAHPAARCFRRSFKATQGRPSLQPAITARYDSQATEAVLSLGNTAVPMHKISAPGHRPVTFPATRVTSGSSVPLCGIRRGPQRRWRRREREVVVHDANGIAGNADITSMRSAATIATRRDPLTE
jgi:hypothetical protein